MFENKYPYTDFNEYNLDWVIVRIKELTEEWLAYKTQMDADWLDMKNDWSSMKEDLEELKTFITTYFDNLDVQEEINNKIDQMAQDGSLLAVIKSTVESKTATTTTAWLNQHITEPEGVVIDTSLTVAGACADAKATGDKITDVNNALEVNGITFTDNYYLDSDGNIYPYNQFKATEDYIPVFDETFNKRRILIKTYLNSAAYVCYYDINKLLIQADTVSGSSATLYEGDTANVPDCAYIRICCYKTREASVILAYPNDNNYETVSKIFPTFYNLFDYKNPNIQEDKFLYGSNIIDAQNLAVSYPIPVQNGVEYKLTAPSTTFGNSSYIAKCNSAGVIDHARNYSIVNNVITFRAYFTGYVLVNIADKTITPRSTIIFAESSVFDKLNKEAITYNGRLKGKKILYNGDSIAESRTGSEANNGGGYPLLISQITGGLYNNRAVGGGTIAVSSGRHNVCTDIANMPSTGDLVCLEGGINDYWVGVPLGDFSPSDYTGTVDNTTLCGAMEYMFRQAINKWVGVPIVFVIIHKVLDTAWTENTQGYTFAEAREKMLGICEKYSIPVLDMWSEGGLNGYIQSLNTAFLNGGAVTQPDGCHPDVNGYKKYYISRLIDLFEKVLPYDESFYS